MPHRRIALAGLLALAAPAFFPPLAPLARAAEAAPAPSPAEQRYFAARDRYIGALAKKPDDARDTQALALLQRQLEPIVGPVRVPGFRPPLKINLETLQADGGFGMVDGLRLQDAAQQQTLVATTPGLLAGYRKRHPALPAGMPALWGDGDFARMAFDWDVAVNPVANLPVRPAPGQRLVRAFLALAAQDTGPFVPNQLYVFAATAGQVLMVSAPVSPALPQIDNCEKAWDGFAREADAVRQHLNPPVSDAGYAQVARLESRGFAAYTACYGRELPHQPGFAPLLAQAQALLDRMR